MGCLHPVLRCLGSRPNTLLWILASCLHTSLGGEGAADDDSNIWVPSTTHMGDLATNTNHTICFAPKTRGEINLDQKAECDEVLRSICSLVSYRLPHPTANILLQTHRLWKKRTCQVHSPRGKLRGSLVFATSNVYKPSDLEDLNSQEHVTKLSITRELSFWKSR